jgi:hypothetical protein
MDPGFPAFAPVAVLTLLALVIALALGTLRRLIIVEARTIKLIEKKTRSFDAACRCEI